MSYDGSLKFDTKIDESGFNSGISKISGAAKKGLAVTAGAVVGVGAALGAMTKQSLDSVSKLEQNVGGVETLFKKSSKTVIANANKAYKTAGMSANEYMQNVTSFSASLLQSCAKDTDRATKVADMAMIDMSDNANKMGTNMVDIQNAYQGFAKQNYTMLDNLKLGYGGTKTEMERLLADAEKISGTKYDINNLADVYNAIHVIQKNLGITGTTAKEAATTIEGSMNSAKAAYDNFLNGSGSAEELADSIAVMMENIGKNLGEIIPRLASTIPELLNILWDDMQGGMEQGIQAGSEMVANILLGITQGIPDFLAVGGQLVMSLASSVSSSAPQLIAAAGQSVMSLGSGIMKALPQIITYGTQIITQIGNAISQAAPELIPKAVEALGQLALGFISALPQLITVGIQMITALAQGLIDSIPLLIEYVPQIINSFCAAIDNGLLQLIAAGVKIIANLVIGIVQAIPQLIGALPQIVLAIYNVFMHINLLSAGKNIIKSLANGLKSSASSVIGAAKNIATFIWNQFVHTDWLSLGKLLIRKLGSGVKGMGGSLGSIAKAVGTKAFNAIKGINWAEAGSKAIQKVASGITGLAGRLGTAAKHAGQKAVSAFRGINWATVGKNIISGIAGGIGAAAGSLYSKLRGIASNALSSAKKALGIHSPSRRFKNEVGRHIVTGIIAGVNSTKKSLLKTMDTLCVSILKKAKNANGNYSDIGKSFVESFTNSVNSKAKSSITAGKNLINKQIDAAKKKNPKAKNAYTKLGKSMIAAYTNAINSESKKLIAAAEKNIEELSETYQKKYDEIIQNRDDMISKMRDAGSLYDLDGNIEALEEYQKRLKGLKNKIPDSLMSEILGMDIADANDYMEYLQSMDPKKLEEYLKKWDKIYTGSSSFGKSFFYSDLKELKSNYEKELQIQLKDLQKKMKQMGMDVMKGFTSGMKSQTKNMSKTVQSMCDQLIKDIRKKLKIKSPSRIMRDKIGKYLPLGISSGFRKWMPEATKRIGKDIDGALNAMRAKVESIEYPKRSPVYINPVQPQASIVVEDKRPIELNAEIHTTVDLDGKKVGKQVTPYVNKNLGEEQTRAERRN